MEEEDVLKLLFDDDHNSNDLELVDEELERELLEEDDHDNLIHKTSESSRSQASGSSRSRVSSPADDKIEVKPRSPAQQLAKHDDNERKTKISTDDLYHPLSEESIKRARLNVKSRRNHPTSSESRKVKSAPFLLKIS